MANDPDVERLARYLRAHGLALKLGVELTPPTLPRSRRIRKALEQKAATDRRVRVALDAAKAAERVKPSRTLRRDFGQILEIR